MFFGLLTMLVALTISAVAIYYSVAGLVAIFAAATIPIIIMGGALEIGKLVTAVWLHRYWNRAAVWLKLYLGVAVLVLMFITSMGIFGFLSKAHIEQTSAAQEQVAQLERFDEEIVRLRELIVRAEERITKAETNADKQDVGIQEKIDKEQERIDNAYTRRQPSIDEQQGIITAQENALANRVAVYEDEIKSLDTELQRLNKLVEDYKAQISNTSIANIEQQVKPYLDQIAQLDEDIKRLDQQAAEYETIITGLQPDLSAIDTLKTQISELEERIAKLQPDYSAVDTLKVQIATVENSIIVTTNKLQSNERDKIREGQAVIGVTSDGLFGSNTTRAYNAWLEAQRARIAELQQQETELRSQAQAVTDRERERLGGLIKDLQQQSSDVRDNAQANVNAERDRLTGLVKDLRGAQTTAVQDRKQGLLDTIDRIRKDAASGLQSTRDGIQVKIDSVLNTDIPANREARKQAQETITSLRNTPDPRIESARKEIARIRGMADDEIAQAQIVIERLRAEIKVGENVDLDALVDEQNARIKTANDEIDKIIEKKFALQAEARKLEAEVGPVKYLAEFIYEETDRDTLEEAVRWVIIIIIFVFDPLAVALLIASQYTIEWNRRKKPGPQVEPIMEEHEAEETELTQDGNIIENANETHLQSSSNVDQQERQQGSDNGRSESGVQDSSTDKESELQETIKTKNDSEIQHSFEEKQLAEVVIPEPDNKKVDKNEYNPYTDTRADEELSKEELAIRKELWPDDYDGKLRPTPPHLMKKK